MGTDSCAAYTAEKIECLERTPSNDTDVSAGEHTGHTPKVTPEGLVDAIVRTPPISAQDTFVNRGKSVEVDPNQRSTEESPSDSAAEFREAVADFDACEYGEDYLNLKMGDIIRCVSEDEGWLFGHSVDPKTRSVKLAEGWFPPTYTVILV